MNFIQTLSFNKSQTPYKDTFGWAAPKYHLMSWALSLLQLKALYGKVDLYCNDAAANLLIHDLGLPYSKVHLSHNELELPDERLWALPKVFTYSLQNEPFLHVDGDVFLFDKLPATLLDSSLIAQNIEEATDYYTQTQLQLERCFTFFPPCVEEDFKRGVPIRAANAGILGGNDVDFIREYAASAFEYIHKNTSNLHLVNVDRFNVFFEQHLFYCLAKEKEIGIDVLIHSTIKDNQYLYLGNFHETPSQRQYLHLLGHYKKDEYTCQLMAAKLRELYPAYYYKIISLIDKDAKPQNASIYIQEKITSLNSYLSFFEASRTAFDLNTTNAGSNNSSAFTTTPYVLSFLRSKIDANETNDLFTKKELLDDFDSFCGNLIASLNCRPRPSNKYLYGRDLDAGSWYCKIFLDEPMVIYISKCDEINLVQSKFDWSGLYLKYTRTAVRYYEDLALEPGEYYHLIVPEVSGDGFSIHDIDEMENLILYHLQSPMLIANLFTLMLPYAEDDIIQNHLEEYKALFYEMLKQLILKKAIMPARNSMLTIV